MMELSAYPWWAWALMCTGAVALVVWVLYPLAWIVLYALGYTIFNMLLIDGANARKRPFRVVRFVLFSWPLAGLLEAVTSPCESTRAGRWRWRPFFRFRRMR